MLLAKENEMLNFLKECYRQPTPLEMATKELAQAMLAKLEAETAVDYAQSIVDYNDARINRLGAYFAQNSKEIK